MALPMLNLHKPRCKAVSSCIMYFFENKWRKHGHWLVDRYWLILNSLKLAFKALMNLVLGLAISKSIGWGFLLTLRKRPRIHSGFELLPVPRLKVLSNSRLAVPLSRVVCLSQRDRMESIFPVFLEQQHCWHDLLGKPVQFQIFLLTDTDRRSGGSATKPGVTHAISSSPALLSGTRQREEAAFMCSPFLRSCNIADKCTKVAALNVAIVSVHNMFVLWLQPAYTLQVLIHQQRSCRGMQESPYG